MNCDISLKTKPMLSCWFLFDLLYVTTKAKKILLTWIGRRYTCRQNLEVLDGFGGGLFEKLHQDSSRWDIVNGDVKVGDGPLIDWPGADERDGRKTGKFVEDGLLGHPGDRKAIIETEVTL